jgi:hypothetical protein
MVAKAIVVVIVFRKVFLAIWIQKFQAAKCQSRMSRNIGPFHAGR